MIAVCLKWVGTRPELDAAGVVSPPDARFSGVSEADRAALELALRSGSANGTDVIAITAGPATAEGVLRDALAAGAARVVRIDLPFGAASADVARAVAPAVAGCAQVWCGDFSTDRGTGAVPAFLAAELGWAQALGLVEVTLHDDFAVSAVRRLDGGRREQLALTRQAVLSVEGSTAHLRRAPLRALLEHPPIDVRAAAAAHPASAVTSRPYRPRPRVLPAPAGASALERVKALTAAASPGSSHAEPIVLDPPAAADRILAALRGWGYLTGA